MSTNIVSDDSVFALGLRLTSRLRSLDLTQERVNAMIGSNKSDPKFMPGFDDLARGNYAQPIKIPDELVLQLGEWRSFYWRLFGLRIDVDKLRVPERVDGVDYPVVVAQGVSINLAVKAHRDLKIPFWKWCGGDLESVMQESERGPVKQSRLIWVHGAQEATDQTGDLLKELPATIIAERKIDTEGLLERLIHGLFYHEETGGRHLDEKSVTLCAASRYADGDVPKVDRRDGGGSVDVYGYSPSYRCPGLRARQAVR